MLVRCRFLVAFDLVDRYHGGVEVAGPLTLGARILLAGGGFAFEFSAVAAGDRDLQSG